MTTDPERGSHARLATWKTPPTGPPPRYAEALDIARRIVEQFGETPQALRDVASSLQRVGYCTALTGHKDEGLADLREALDIFTRLVERYGETWESRNDIEKTQQPIEAVEALP